MKTVTLSLLFVLMAMVSSFAQGNNLIFFAPEGESFYVIINGIRQNDVAQTNVMVQNVNAALVKVKIIFDDTNLGVVDKTLPMPEYPAEVTYQIKTAKDGKYVVRYFGDVALAQAPPPPANRNVVVFTTTAAPPTTTTTVVTQTTTTGVNTGTGENVNVGMNIGGFGMDVNVNVNDNMGGNVVYEETTTVTTTTTGSTTTTGTGVRPMDVDHYVMAGYNGPIGCSWPMSDADFASAKQSISSKSFSDSQLTLAKQILNSNCMTSNQVKEVMMIFDFESTRLDFAKYAYGYTFDLGNYYKVNDAFDFESSINELNKYIEGR